MHTFRRSPYLKRISLSYETSSTIFQNHELGIVCCAFCSVIYMWNFHTPTPCLSGVFRCHQRPCTSNADDHVTLADVDGECQVYCHISYMHIMFHVFGISWLDYMRIMYFYSQWNFVCWFVSSGHGDAIWGIFLHVVSKYRSRKSEHGVLTTKKMDILRFIVER